MENKLVVLITIIPLRITRIYTNFTQDCLVLCQTLQNMKKT